MSEPVVGHPAANILGFCRALRKAGLPVGTAAMLDGLRAVAAAGLVRRDDVQAALRCALLTDHTQLALFDELFRAYFESSRSEADGTAQPHFPAPGVAENVTGTPLSLSAGHEPNELVRDSTAMEQSSGEVYSALERLRRKDFDGMTDAELSVAMQVLAADLKFPAEATSRRFQATGSATSVDLRRSLRLMTRAAGEPLFWAKKSRRSSPPAFVLLGDVSASMRKYSRLFLAFAHALTARERSVHSFVFATRLSNVTAELQHRDVNAALAGVSAQVEDWDGGTRIGSALRRFNVDWGRRILSGNTVVVLLSDGLERDVGTHLRAEMQRLALSCRRLIWLNPLLRFDHFEPLASGIQKMLPAVDRMIPAHNVSSLAALDKLLARDELSLSAAGRRGQWQ